MAKKNPFKGPLILTVSALVLVGLTYFVIKPHKESSDKQQEKSTLLFGELERAKVVDFKVEGPGGQYHVKKKADADDWIVSADKTFGADKGVVDGMVTTFLAAKKEGSVANQDLAAIGLQPAKYSLTVEGSDGKARVLQIGEDTPVEYLVYAKWADAKDIMTTSRSVRFGVDKKLSELRNRKVVSVATDRVEKIEVKTLAKDKMPSRVLTFAKTPNGDWATADGKIKNLKKDEVEKFLKALSGLSVTGFVSENQADRRSYGASNPMAKVVLTLKSADGKAPGETQVWVLGQGTFDKKPKTVFWLEGADTTYEVADTFKDTFLIDLLKFRNRKILSQVAVNDITGLSISDTKNQIDFIRKGNDWTLKNDPTNAGKVKSGMIESARSLLMGLEAAEFLDGQSPGQTGLRSPSRIVELHGTKNGAETTLATIVFGAKFKNDEVVVRSDGMDSAAKVRFHLDETLPMSLDKWVEAPQTQAAPTPQLTAPKGKDKKVKLAPTVNSVKEIRKLPSPIVKPGFKYTGKITFQDDRVMGISFFADKAPYTVSNFLHLARNGFYNGVKFHRVIADFVAQGGDPTGLGSGGPGYKFNNEDNDLKHERGSLSMAHAGRDTNGSQFFVVLKPQPHLNGVHTVFGQVTEGLHLIEGIKVGDTMKTVDVFEEAL